MATPIMDFDPLELMTGRVRLCCNCEYEKDVENCPLLMKEPKVISGRGYNTPYTAGWAQGDIRNDHCCYIHRYGAQEGDGPVCKLVKGFASKPYASCQACDKEYGLEGPPCCD